MGAATGLRESSSASISGGPSEAESFSATQQLAEALDERQDLRLTRRARGPLPAGEGYWEVSCPFRRDGVRLAQVASAG